MIETKLVKVVIYATIIVKQQKETVITPIFKPYIQIIDFFITPVKGTTKCY